MKIIFIERKNIMDIFYKMERRDKYVIKFNDKELTGIRTGNEKIVDFVDSLRFDFYTNVNKTNKHWTVRLSNLFCIIYDEVKYYFI